MEAAIARDDIIWHANAVNFLTEVLDEPLWDYSLGMKNTLNKRFNKSHGIIAGKLADVCTLLCLQSRLGKRLWFKQFCSLAYSNCSIADDWHVKECHPNAR